MGKKIAVEWLEKDFDWDKFIEEFNLKMSIEHEK